MDINEGNNLHDYSEILDKLLKLDGDKKKYPSAVKIILCIAGCIAFLMFIALICFTIYKNSINMDSILSVMLAFFSIFISVFFYFKAEDTSAKFYDNSYNFMKDISVTLGKIEERFGEKLNSMNEKLSHIDNAKQVTKDELENAEHEKDRIINELMEKAKLTEGEKEKYKVSLIEKEKETEMIKRKLYRIENEYQKQREDINRITSDNDHNIHNYERVNYIFRYFNPEELLSMLRGQVNNISTQNIKRAREIGLIDSNNNITKEGYEIINSIIHNN